MNILRRVWRRLFGMRIKRNPEVEEAMKGKEIVYKAPILTRELVKGVHLITPDIRLELTEDSRRFWELDQNCSSWAEMAALTQILQNRPKPTRVLELGPGFGRSVVFFTKKLGWDPKDYHLFEANGKRTRYTIGGPKFSDSFCGNIPLLKQLLEFNGVKNFKVLDASDVNYDLKQLTGPYDVIYSFYAVGFHWSIEHFLGDIQALMKKDSIGIFTVPLNFIPFERLSTLQYKVLSTQRTASDPVKILVISMKSL